MIDNEKKLYIVMGCLCCFLVSGLIIGLWKAGILKEDAGSEERYPCYESMEDAKMDKSCLTYGVMANIYGGNFMAMIGCLTCCYLFTSLFMSGTSNLASIRENPGVYTIVLWGLLSIAFIAIPSSMAMGWYGYYQGDKAQCYCMKPLLDENNKPIIDEMIPADAPLGQRIKYKTVSSKTDFLADPFVITRKGIVPTIQLWITRIAGYGTTCIWFLICFLFVLQWVERAKYTEE